MCEGYKVRVQALLVLLQPLCSCSQNAGGEASWVGEIGQIRGQRLSYFMRLRHLGTFPRGPSFSLPGRFSRCQCLWGPVSVLPRTPFSELTWNFRFFWARLGCPSLLCLSQRCLAFYRKPPGPTGNEPEARRQDGEMWGVASD